MVLHHLLFYSKIMFYQNNLQDHSSLNQIHHKIHIQV